MNGAHILVIDDDSRLRALLRKYLAENGYRVSTADNAADARAKLAGLAFDLLVVDVMMPGENGLAFTESLRHHSRVPILLLTAMGEPADRIIGLERGADDYLTKPFEPRELLLRIGSILRRARRPETVDIAFGDYRFDVGRNRLRCDGRTVHLTTSETALLRTFADNPGVILSRRHLSDRAGGGSERSIDVQIARLRRKIEADPKAPRHLQTVRGEGYVLWAA
jgi:two-component system phosphate regulon response regulator OmpR